MRMLRAALLVVALSGPALGLHPPPLRSLERGHDDHDDDEREGLGLHDVHLVQASLELYSPSPCM